MTEKFLQYLWRFQQFNHSGLALSSGEPLQVIHPGTLNHNQGPDFLNARILINNTTWAGNIELHVISSDWRLHNHSIDKNYHNIILHVVWQHNEEILDSNSQSLPTLVLEDKVPFHVIAKFDALKLYKGFVPCQPHLPVLNEVNWVAWKERVAVERLQRKAATVLENVKLANNHWEEVFWWALAKNFGIKVNADVFETIAKSISINILARHKNQIQQIEALLFGQAGFLEAKFEEDYPLLLQREYRFLQKKYKLVQSTVKPFFLRMRPANFPTIRLAQLAMLIHTSSHLFSKIKEIEEIEKVRELLDVTPNDYWHYHYMLDKATVFKPKPLGQTMIDNIISNTIVPVLFAYGLQNKDEALKEKALTWLEKLPAEKNSITINWSKYKVLSTNALESQGLIELKNNYCDHIKCLDCSVGISLLKSPPPLSAVANKSEGFKL
ncbi:MAG: hypothetical protein JWQ96_2591 [Segetibacter sp.]|nr:hypothetical protein [Segetibacter sp.]